MALSFTLSIVGISKYQVYDNQTYPILANLSLGLSPALKDYGQIFKGDKTKWLGT